MVKGIRAEMEMVEFKEFKTKVCDFYKQNRMTYFVWYIPEYDKCSIQISFRMDNIDVLFTYELTGFSNDSQRDRKAERLMKDLHASLDSIKNS